MREFSKKFHVGGEEGSPLPLTMDIHCTSGKRDRPKLNDREYGGKFQIFSRTLSMNNPVFYLLFVSKFHINHLFTVIIHKSIGSFGSRPPWRV